MSDSENTNELDSYGVWVKNPPKTVDSSVSDNSSNSFDIDADLPDFSELDSLNIPDNTGIDYDDSDTALSADELSAIAAVSEDIETPAMDEVSEAAFEEVASPSTSGEEEIDLSEFGFDMSEDDNSPSSEPAPSAPADSAEESVDLSDFGFEDTPAEDPAVETSVQEPVEEDAPIDIDLTFDDEPKMEATEAIVEESAPLSENSAAPEGTEEIDLSEFGFDDSADESGTSEPSAPVTEEAASDEGMESVDLSEFGFDDISTESIGEETPAPKAESNDFDMNVMADDDMEADPVPDAVTETTPESSFVTEEDSDFDVDAIMADVTDENGNTTSLNTAEEALIKEEENLSLDNSEPEIESETIEDFSAITADSVAEDIAVTQEIPDTFDEETASFLDDSGDTTETVEFAENIKAPILDENDESSQPTSQMTAIFNQIVGELSSLKNEIASLKNDLSQLKNTNTSEISVASNDSSEGFFSGSDEDDTIALSTDELDNILNTADFTSEEGGTEPDSFASEEVSEDVTPETEIPETSDILGDVEETPEVPEDSISEQSDLSMDFSNETLVEPALDEIDASMEADVEPSAELPEEISVPKVDDIFVESSSTDLMEETSEEPVLEMPEESVEEIPEMDAEPVIEEVTDNTTESDNTVDSMINDPFFQDEPSIEETLTEEKIDYLEENVEPEEDNSISGDLKTEIKSVLSYMDQLLENLPEEKIAEFAQSEQFDAYKKLFKELGLA